MLTIYQQQAKSIQLIQTVSATMILTTTDSELGRQVVLLEH